MEDKSETQDDILMRSETVPEISGDVLMGGKPNPGFPGNVLDFCNRYKKWLHLLIAVLIFIALTILVVLIGGESTYEQRKTEIEAEFNRMKLSNYVTISSYKDEDNSALVASALLSITSKFDAQAEAKIYMQYNEFNRQFEKRHSSWNEKKEKFLIFRENLNRINTHNGKDDRLFKMRMNKLGDMTSEEFMLRLNLKMGGISNVHPVLKQRQQLAEDVDIDLRRSGKMTPVKDQGSCGSCWAFATVGVIESYFKQMTGSVVSLSEQQLVDCVSESNGCSGGDPFFAFTYAKKNGLYNSFVYRYQAVDGACLDNLNGNKYIIPSFTAAEDNIDFATILKKHGPSTTVVAANEDWQFYHRGVIDVCGPKINHAVVLAGMGKHDDTKFWLIKNSWGDSWGEDGYAKVLRAHTENYSNCGIDTFSIHVPISTN
ncbi:bifunctional Cysteine peptidase [Babesia duncani]|uniref:Bifunctional Cysteine peptidase n=1 Tax=Babesia duncani TaxID=323732 RepID=A0AAD9PI97_9APIC|nr:bifunctional Cysteine peptidase [Babesia duncani]